MLWIAGWCVASALFAVAWKRGMDAINPLKGTEFNTWPSED